MVPLVEFVLIHYADILGRRDRVGSYKQLPQIIGEYSRILVLYKTKTKLR